LITEIGVRREARFLQTTKDRLDGA
jgi:hypothetical protein